MAAEDFEDVGGDIANKDFAESAYAEDEYVESKNIKRRRHRPHNPTKRRINELAHQIRDLRNKKKSIDEQLKGLTGEVIDLMDLVNKDKIYTEDFIVSLSTRANTTIDRDYLRRNHPSVYRKAVKQGAISTAVYIKDLEVE